jgi:alginate O-acetyltransferase complex protein AlgI
MVFSSQIFIYYFLPTALLGYYLLCRAPQRWRNLWLVLTGYFFYGWAGPGFTVLMFATTSFDWLMSLVIARDDWHIWRGGDVSLVPAGTRTRKQKLALFLSILSNLTVLGFFKYFNFTVGSFNGFTGFLGLSQAQWHTTFQVILPLGISFYTFQALSYIIDVYRGEAVAMVNFIDFSCFVSMFPHLVAGPILKFSFLSPQLTSRTLTAEKFARGVSFFCLGLAKKILLANPCGSIADAAFNAHSVGCIDAWFGAAAYAFQIYFDFSGDSDMAIGLGLMLGFVFAKNFDSPYCAESVSDFWRRWHISLSTWLREYVYIPLGGNRQGEVRTYANLMLTMLLGGLWHGASWNFVIWGGIHGGMLALERTRQRQSLYAMLPKAIRIGITFLIVTLSWVFFRAADLPAAITYLSSMFGFGRPDPESLLVSGIIYDRYLIFSWVLAAVVVWVAPQTWNWTQVMTWPKTAACFVLTAIALGVLAAQQSNPFIYFIF